MSVFSALLIITLALYAGSLHAQPSSVYASRSIKPMIASATAPAPATKTATPPAATAVADDSENPPEPEWAGSVKLGFVSVQGNTESSSFLIKNKLVHNSEEWRQTAKFDAFNQVHNNRRIGEKYFASVQGDKKLEERDYIFALMEYEDNRFGGFAYEFSSAAGYGREIFDTRIHYLVVEFGPAWRQREENRTGYVDKNLGLRLNINYMFDISPTAKFTEEFSGEAGNEKNVIKSVTNLTTKINHSLAMTLGYTYRRSSVVPEGRKNLDTETTVTLDYNF